MSENTNKVQLVGWRCAAVKIAIIPPLFIFGVGLTIFIPFLLVAGICLLPFLPIYKTSGFGISLGEGEGE